METLLLKKLECHPVSNRFWTHDLVDRTTFSVLLGSSQILLLQKIRESLAGRVFIHELFPLTLKELYQKEKSDPAVPLISRILSAPETFTHLLDSIEKHTLPEQEAGHKEALHHLLSWGGMPALLKLEDNERLEWLRAYTATYLERDLADISRLNDLEPFYKFQRLAASRSSGILSYSDLARDAGISISSARRYLEYLRISYQAFLVPPYTANFSKSIIKAPKIYWGDLGIYRHITGFWGEATGPVFETLVAEELLKALKYQRSSCKLFYYRTYAGLEVDFILETPEGIIGIEVKNRTELRKTDAKPLRLISKIKGMKWLGGLVIYNGTEVRQLDATNIWTMPVGRLFI